MKRVITGLDIGTSKICAAIAELGRDNKIKILGVGVTQAKGINKGFVSNLDRLVDSIAKAVQSAQERTDVRVHSVVTNISGATVSGRLTEGIIPLSRRGRVITKKDIRKVIEMTKNISLTLEKDLLYCKPQEFVVDEHDGVEEALGLFGTKLKVRLYVISALATHIQNIKKAITYAGYEPVDIIPISIAAASSVLTQEDINNGVVFLDIGGGITEMSVFHRGKLIFFDTVNVGGMDFTASLSAHFRIPFDNAEIIKRKYGSVSRKYCKTPRKDVFNINGRSITIDRSIMSTLLKARFEEIFFILKERLKASGHIDGSIHRLVITGGSSLLDGALDAFEESFKIPVKNWNFDGIDGDLAYLSDPVCYGAISLAKYGVDKHKPKMYNKPFDRSIFFTGIFDRIRDFLDEYF